MQCFNLLLDDGPFESHGEAKWGDAGWIVPMLNGAKNSIYATFELDASIGRSIVDVEMKVEAGTNAGVEWWSNVIAHYYGSTTTFESGPPLWGLQLSGSGQYVDFWPNGGPSDPPQSVVNVPLRELDGRLTLTTTWAEDGGVVIRDQGGRSTALPFGVLGSGQPGSRSLTIEIGGFAPNGVSATSFTVRSICVLLERR
ncbi:MAG: hypothetical protein KIT84_23060 [Labilithrix sp.]|nr:hypothetical protein [Labilithrix sp.]MCW5813926.1 hypothetical protein [Labilithrix sp.]